MARALLTSRPGPARGVGAPGHRKESKNHCWVGRAQTCFVPGLQRGECKTLLGLDGGGAGPNMFCPRTTKLTEKREKNTSGGFGGAGSQLGADRFIYARRFLLELHPPSKSGSEAPGH